MNSWGRMDSHTEPDGTFVFGENDLSLAKRLCTAGSGPPEIHPADLRLGRPDRAAVLVEGVRHV
jgi:hypothetical protein